MNERELPEWMVQTQPYEPGRDHDQFVKKSMLGLIGILSRARKSGSAGKQFASAPVHLFCAIFLILLMSLSRNMFFTYCMLGGFLIRLCLLPEKQLAGVVWSALAAAAISALFLLPAVFLGNPRSLVTISLKVLLSVGLIRCMSATTPWNQLTEGLRFYHVPDLFIFTFDITLTYIVLLGEIAQDMLQALRLRSVGVNPKKEKSMSGVLGITFLKAKELSEETYQAMVARGFEGEYRRPCRICLSWKDAVMLGGAAVIFVLFLKLEGYI